MHSGGEAEPLRQLPDFWNFERTAKCSPGRLGSLAQGAVGFESQALELVGGAACPALDGRIRGTEDSVPSFVLSPRRMARASQGLV